MALISLCAVTELKKKKKRMQLFIAVISQWQMPAGFSHQSQCHFIREAKYKINKQAVLTQHGLASP